MEHIPGGNKATGSQPEVHEILAAEAGRRLGGQVGRITGRGAG